MQNKGTEVEHTIKKLILLFTALCTLLAVCSCAIPKESGDVVDNADPTPIINNSDSKPIIPYEKVETITWARVSGEPLGIEAKEYIMLRFGLKINERFFTSQNMDTQILQLYSANIAPELATGISVQTAKILAERGYLLNLNDERESLADYFELWSGNKAGWAYTETDITITDDDGTDNLFCIVPMNRRASRAWIYDVTAFDDAKMRFPRTVEQLYEQLVQYREKHTTSLALWTNQYAPLQFTALLNAYGLTDDKWQTDQTGGVFYLYGDRDWYRALEWLTKFEKAELVPVDDKGILNALEDDDYNTLTKDSGQIIEFTDSWNYLYIQSKNRKDHEWAVADAMISAGDSTKPALSANLPYINEATCMWNNITSERKTQTLAFLNWCCTDTGNMWANFGSEGNTYTINEEGEIIFLKYYSDEITPTLDEDETGSVFDTTVGRMFTTTPWDKVTVPGASNRYAAEEKFLNDVEVRLVYPERFSGIDEVVEDKTLLWEYNQIAGELDRLATAFEAFSRKNGFSDYYWEQYYASLVEAGLNEYTLLMQIRKR